MSNLCKGLTKKLVTPVERFVAFYRFGKSMLTSAESTLYVGPVVHAVSRDQVQFIGRAYILADGTGTIQSVLHEPPVDLALHKVVQATEGQFWCPGFVDCHTHAPQHENLGLGMSYNLIEWLNHLTFPTERSFKERKESDTFFDALVDRYVGNGTTCCCYYGSIHTETCLELAKACERTGQRAFVGKVCMDCNAPHDYIESLEEAIEGTKKVIHELGKMALVEPIVTPRFAVCCTGDLMKQLGSLAKATETRMQTHLAEMQGECRLVHEFFPTSSSYTDVYHENNILGTNTIMAHCIHLSSHELDLLERTDTAIAHCPSSNFNLSSGCADVRLFWRHGLRVGLGTDVSGGSSLSMLDAMRQAMTCSKALSFFQPNEAQDRQPLSIKEAFYLATLGGAEALNIPTGSITPGKSWDALLVDVNSNRMLPSMSNSSLSNMLERFVMCGDDRNVLQVYIQGKRVK